MRGYSQAVIEANQAAPAGLGVQLGAVCIASKHPASQVAKALNVSRQTVYDWFSGKTNPTKDRETKIQELIKTIK